MKMIASADNNWAIAVSYTHLDYNAKSIPQDVMDSGFTTTPVTPFGEVYYALKTITDDITGVADKNKVVLGISIDVYKRQL